MGHKDTHSVIAIAGPTAVGKTRVSVEVSAWFNCPVVSADSRQVYKELHIGTAKPSRQVLRRTPHYFIDHISVTEPYSAGKYEREFLALVDKLFLTHPTVILTGGTGLFLKAALEGLDQFPPVPRAIRQKWEKALEERGIETLRKAIRHLDPAFARVVDMHNAMRLIRALSVTEASGKPYSFFLQKNPETRTFKAIRILLNLPREELYARIDRRVDEMMQQGLLEEVKEMMPFRQLQALQTVGYKELFKYLDGTWSLDEAVAKIKQHSRNYAKRQMTWFRNQDAFTVFHPDNLEEIKSFIQTQLP